MPPTVTEPRSGHAASRRLTKRNDDAAIATLPRISLSSGPERQFAAPCKEARHAKHSRTFGLRAVSFGRFWLRRRVCCRRPHGVDTSLTGRESCGRHAAAVAPRRRTTTAQAPARSVRRLQVTQRRRNVQRDLQRPHDDWNLSQATTRRGRIGVRPATPTGAAPSGLESNAHRHCARAQTRSTRTRNPRLLSRSLLSIARGIPSCGARVPDSIACIDDSTKGNRCPRNIRKM